MLLQKPDHFVNKIASYLKLTGESDPKKKDSSTILLID